MSSPLYDRIEQAHAEFDRVQATLADIQDSLGSTETTATSKNRALSVTVDGRGEISDIKFLTRSYRTMPPAELTAMLIETIREARAQARTAMAEAFQPVFPPGSPLADIINGRVDLEAMMQQAMDTVNGSVLGDDRRSDGQGERP
ncbi:YbaB/EbfC family nucleoid-associated protein [Dactylosporangium sp. NPDC005572]|uniref:YbaB/EbfC family nucleoid-associated protein n=1 Tax=Dactylosporangium sp. NPDC005572 TaxID=3156889 RepID=UPI0033A826D3